MNRLREALRPDAIAASRRQTGDRRNGCDCVRSNRSIAVVLLAMSALSGWCWAADVVEGPLDLEPEEVRPGLLAVYRSLVDRDAEFRRIDSKPAFTLGHSSPHFRLPAGPFEAVWRGSLQLKESAPITFHASLGGELTMVVDGVTVLKGRGLSNRGEIRGDHPFERPTGYYATTIRYRSLGDVPARLQLSWESPEFAREPLPAWRFGHREDDLTPADRQEALAWEGRAAADRLGCARCHQGAFPGLDASPTGPSLADAGGRLSRAWLLRWLEKPSQVRVGAQMPSLFAPDRRGFVERWIIADSLAQPEADVGMKRPAPGDHRAGRLAFLGLGCAACHFVPDLPRAEQKDLDRVPLIGLGDRLRSSDLATFLGNPSGRYPDGRMPRLPVAPETARDIAGYLLLWSKPSPDQEAGTPPSEAEIGSVARRLGVGGRASVASGLLREKGCCACHPGLGQPWPLDVALRTTNSLGCLSDQGLPHYTLDESTRKALAAYLPMASREKHPSTFATRRQQLERAGCVRCHQRDSDRPSPLEAAGSTLGAGYLMSLPYQRAPRLTNPHQRFTRAHLIKAVRDGVTGLRPTEYTYRMPAFGQNAELLVQALAEQDGELPDEADPAVRLADDPTVGTLAGPDLIGSSGYGCISCHLWNGQQFSQPDPGAVGSDLTRVAGRIRRDWFDRFLEAPERSCPGTPMPAIFARGQPATLASVLGGNPGKQKDALWSYFAQGKRAPAPKPPQPFPIAGPQPGESPLVAQIPIHLPDRTVVESLCVLSANHDLLVYDLGRFAPRQLFCGAQILRSVQGRSRKFLASGTPGGHSLDVEPALKLRGVAGPEVPDAFELHGYDRLSDGARIRWRARFASGPVEVEETLRLSRTGEVGQLLRELQLKGIPERAVLELRARTLENRTVDITASNGTATVSTADGISVATLTPDRAQNLVASVRYELPAPRPVPRWEGKPVNDPGQIEGALSRPGYRAVPFPRPKTVSGEDRVMPVALAVDPCDGRLFVASLKTGELFVVRDPGDDKTSERFENYGRGLFQDALSMRAEKDGLHMLHRRNLTRITDTDGDGIADRFDREAALPHGIADTYDYAYGLVRDKVGGFLVSYAPYANTQLPGSGGAVRLLPGQAPREVAFGFRNPLGWCVGPKGEVFFTDNQGEWVASNKLSHLGEGHYHGFPNSAQKEHAKKPAERAAIWIPYGWAHSINGVAYDDTAGKFGPFAGQFFLAELMFGGAILRADVEEVKGQYQGACFPFWGKGLMGPVSLAFDPKGRLYAGGITEPGWMAQPDRGALFRLEYTGVTPFELQSIRARAHGFRIQLTQPAEVGSLAAPSSYHVEHYRYETTGAYGSPELDRASLTIEGVRPSEDRRSVTLTTAPLVAGRVYLISAPGVRSTKGEGLVYPLGAYTLNEIPPAEPNEHSDP